MFLYVSRAFLQESKKREQHLEHLREETENKLSEANNESMQVSAVQETLTVTLLPETPQFAVTTGCSS